MDAILKIYARGEIPSSTAALVLQRTSDAYAGLSALHQISAENLLRRTVGFHYNIEHSVWVPEADFDDDELQLKAVVLQSPGAWEFLGKINPLEVIRVYLNDRHNRKQDVEYRNNFEAERLWIENRILALSLIKDTISVAKESGMSDHDISLLVRDNAVLPLARLESLQDMSVISDATITVSDEEAAVQHEKT